MIVVHRDLKYILAEVPCTVDRRSSSRQRDDDETDSHPFGFPSTVTPCPLNTLGGRDRLQVSNFIPALASWSPVGHSSFIDGPEATQQKTRTLSYSWATTFNSHSASKLSAWSVKLVFPLEIFCVGYSGVFFFGSATDPLSYRIAVPVFCHPSSCLMALLTFPSAATQRPMWHCRYASPFFRMAVHTHV